MNKGTADLLTSLKTHASRTARHSDFELTYSAEEGRRYDRIVVASRLDGSQWSSHRVQCFVDKATGAVLYAAGWAKPAKWTTGLASEFNAQEYDLYAKCVALGLWGYKGDRSQFEGKIS